MLAFAVPKDATPSNFVEKTSRIATKLQVFSLGSFPLYGIDRKEHPERNWKSLFNTKLYKCADTYKALTL